jgi:hypothetical protein
VSQRVEVKKATKKLLKIFLLNKKTNNHGDNSEIAFTFVTFAVVCRILLLTQWPNFGFVCLFVCPPPDF